MAQNMVEEEKEKSAEASRQVIQVQTGDIEVAKLQLAARWAEQTAQNGQLEDLLKAFTSAFKTIDETLRL